MGIRHDSYEALMEEVERQSQASELRAIHEQYQKFGLDITESPELRSAVIDDARNELTRIMYALDEDYGSREGSHKVTDALRSVIRMASVGGDFIPSLQEYAIEMRKFIGGGPMTDRDMYYAFKNTLRMADRIGFKREAESWFKETRGFIRRTFNLETEDGLEEPEE